MEIKTKVNKWDLIKFKSFCTGKETTRWKYNPDNGKKKITNKTTGKGLISKIYSSSYNSIPEKQTTQSKRGQKDPNRTSFSKEDTQMAKKH